MATKMVAEDKVSEVLILGDDDPTLGLRFAEKIGVWRLHEQFCGIKNVMTLAP